MIHRTRWARSLVLVACCLAVASVIVACGGGGGGGSGGAGASNAPALPTSTVKASVDADRVSTPNGQLVTRVASPFGEAAIGGDVSVAKVAAGAPTMMIGLDAAGNERLLRFEEGEGALSADTTAYALVRLGLLLADRPAGIASSRPAALIRKSSAYGAVVTAVKASLTAATPGGTTASADLADKVALAVQDVLTMDSRAAATGAGDPNPALLLQAQVTGTPYYFWNEDGANQAWLSEGPLTFNNQTFIYWHLSAKSATGSWEGMANPLASTSAQLVALYAGSATKTAISPPGDKFTLTVDQNKASQLNNAIAAVTRSTSALVEVIVGATGTELSGINGCVAGVAKEIAMNDEFGPLLTNFSAAGLADFVWDKKLSLVHTLLSECSNDGPAEDSVIKRFTNLPAIKTISKVYKALQAARSATAAYGSIAQFEAAARHATTVSICIKDGKITSKCEDTVTPPVTPPVTPVTPPVQTPGVSCPAQMDLLAAEFNAINARRPASASTIDQLRAIMYMTAKAIATMQQFCQAEPGLAETIASYQASYNGALQACTQIASNPSVCVAGVAW